MKISHPHSQTGFSLIELLVVVVIMGILASLAIPSFVNISKRARYAEAKQALNSIGKDVKMFYVENNSYPRDVQPNIQPDGVVNWPDTVPFDSTIDYDHWGIGGGKCYVQIAFRGESNSLSYGLFAQNVESPPGLKKIDDNLVLGIDVYDCKNPRGAIR